MKTLQGRQRFTRFLNVFQQPWRKGEGKKEGKRKKEGKEGAGGNRRTSSANSTKRSADSRNYLPRESDGRGEEEKKEGREKTRPTGVLIPGLS